MSCDTYLVSSLKFSRNKVIFQVSRTLCNYKSYHQLWSAIRKLWSAIRCTYNFSALRTSNALSSIDSMSFFSSDLKYDNIFQLRRMCCKTGLMTHNHTIDAILNHDALWSRQGKKILFKDVGTNVCHVLQWEFDNFLRILLHYYVVMA